MPPRKPHPEQGAMFGPSPFEQEHEIALPEERQFPTAAPLPEPVKPIVSKIEIPEPVGGETGTYVNLKDRPGQLGKLIRALDCFSKANNLDGYYYNLTNPDNPKFRQEEFKEFKEKERKRAKEKGLPAKTNEELGADFRAYVKAMPKRIDDNLAEASRLYQEATSKDYDALRASGVFDPQGIDNEEDIAAKEFEDTYAPPDSHKLRNRAVHKRTKSKRTDTRRHFKKASEGAIKKYLTPKAVGSSDPANEN